ncbi:NAD(P)-binding protein, partial [Rhizopogon salebrosus TDB-379]
VVVVTGSGQGIGRSTAMRLAEDGYDVAINDLESSKEKLDAVRKEITANFRERRVFIILQVADITIEEKVKGSVESVVKEFGKLNVVTTLDNFESVLSVNVTGTYCYKYAAQEMIAQGDGGRIVGASSMTGKKGKCSYMWSHDVFFCLHNRYDYAIAIELGHHGITVKAYAPGAIETLMREFREYPSMSYINATRLVSCNRQQLNSSSVGHLGSTKDAANLVSFLVTPEAHFITG